MCSLPEWNRFEKARRNSAGRLTAKYGAKRCDRNLNFTHGDSLVTASLQYCIREQLMGALDVGEAVIRISERTSALVRYTSQW